MLSASVVIPIFNGAAVIGRCLDALHAQTTPIHEIIIVDDGSIDRSREIIESYLPQMPNLKYFYSGQRKRSAAARNYGVARSSGEIIVFTDDDAYADPNWIAEILSPFADPQVGAVTGETKNDGLSIFPWKFTPLSPKNVMCNMAFRRTVIDAIGGLDENFEELGSDVDLAMRVTELACEIADAPKAIIYHPAKLFSFKRLLARAERYRLNSLLYKKYPNDLQNYGSIFRPWIGGFSLCGLAFLTILVSFLIILAMNPLLALYFLLTFFCLSWVFFILYAYKFCVVCNAQNEKITFAMKNKTYFILIWFLPFLLLNRLIGSFIHRKFLF